jgi:hypothetical protein
MKHIKDRKLFEQKSNFHLDKFESSGFMTTGVKIIFKPI